MSDGSHMSCPGASCALQMAHIRAAIRLGLLHGARNMLSPCGCPLWHFWGTEDLIFNLQIHLKSVLSSRKIQKTKRINNNTIINDYIYSKIELIPF